MTEQDGRFADRGRGQRFVCHRCPAEFESERGPQTREWMHQVAEHIRGHRQQENTMESE